MKRAIVAFLIGVAVSIPAFLAAGFGGGACHCNTPLEVIFPLGTLLMRSLGEDAGTILLLLQFPLYALAVALPATDLRRTLWIGGIAALHFVAAFAAVTSRGSFR